MMYFYIDNVNLCKMCVYVFGGVRRLYFVYLCHNKFIPFIGECVFLQKVNLGPSTEIKAFVVTLSATLV